MTTANAEMLDQIKSGQGFIAAQWLGTLMQREQLLVRFQSKVRKDLTPSPSSSVNTFAWRSKAHGYFAFGVKHTVGHLPR